MIAVVGNLRDFRGNVTGVQVEYGVVPQGEKVRGEAWNQRRNIIVELCLLGTHYGCTIYIILMYFYNV